MTLRYSAAVRAERARFAAAGVAAAEDRRHRREAVMQLLAAGDLRASEAASMLGVSDRTVWRWCKAAGINPRQARRDLLARLSKVAHLFAPLFDQMMRERNQEQMTAARISLGPDGSPPIGAGVPICLPANADPHQVKLDRDIAALDERLASLLAGAADEHSRAVYLSLAAGLADAKADRDAAVELEASVRMESA